MGCALVLTMSMAREIIPTSSGFCLEKTFETIIRDPPLCIFQIVSLVPEIAPVSLLQTPSFQLTDYLKITA